jgi:PAS domain S-box-containing protein
VASPLLRYTSVLRLREPGSGRDVATVHAVPTLLETALESLRTAVLADGAALIGRDGQILATAGVPLGDLRLSTRGAAEEQRWVEDASRANALLRSAQRRAAGVIPIAGDRFVLIVRDAVGPWHPHHIHAAEALAPLVGHIADELLRDSEAHFHKLVDDAPVMLWTMNARGECDFINRRLQDFFGAEDLALLGAGWLDAVHPDDRDETAAVVEDWIRSRAWARREVRARSSDGFHNFLIEAAPRYGPDGTFLGLIGSCVDVTERDLLEQRLEEKKRLSSLGRLAATIAHEMNNVLMGIQPFASIITRTNDRYALERASMHISNAISRGRRITHEILRFANATEPELAPIDVRGWLDAHREELEGVLGPSITFEIQVEPGLRILADAVQLQQVFTNLATNARDALTATVNGGRFSIEARTASARRAAALPDPGPYVHFIIRDSGPGIPPEILDRIFEPLFTTKTTGTGLGLAVVAEIVRKHGGDVQIESTPDDGTCVHLLLRATSEPVALEEIARDDRFPSSVRKLLLVEDNTTVADGLVALLALEGVAVEVADCGAAALAAVERFDPDLVLLDLGLPDMHGTEVFTRIRERHPELPILFSTGHGGEAELDSFLKQNFTGYLLKPYDLASLIAATRGALGDG